MKLTGNKFENLIKLYSSFVENKPVYLVQRSVEGNIILCSSGLSNLSSDVSQIIDNAIKQSDLSADQLTIESEANGQEINKEFLSKLDIHKLHTGEFSEFYLVSADTNSKSGCDQLELIKNSVIERISYEEEINKRYKETTSNINTVIYSTNADGSKYYFISNSVEKLFNLTVNQIISNKLSLLRKIVPEYFEGYNKFIKELKTGKRAEFEYQYYYGPEKIKRWVRHTGNPVMINGKVERVVGIIDDITEEKSILQKLEKSEEKFRLLIETASDLIISLNSFGYVSLVNRFGAKTLGYKPNELLGKHFLELIDENTRSDTIDAFQKILSSEEVTQFEAALIDKFENTVLYEFQATPLKDEGIISGMLALGRDVTKRRKDENRMKELNTKLVEANRLISIERDRAKQQLTVLEELNKLKNDFVSRVSHELRTPLASIVGFAETIVSDEDLPPEMISEFSNIILTEGKRLAKLVNDVLDFSKLETVGENFNREDVDIIKILKQLGESFAQYSESQKVTINFEIPEDEIIIFADREMISKALGGVIENSIKFNNPGGRVTIVLQDFKNEIEVLINDTGMGISAEELPKLFNKFAKFDSTATQSAGTGLGLAYLKQVIDLHRGLIQVKSELNKGSTFIIRLPKKK